MEETEEFEEFDDEDELEDAIEELDLDGSEAL